jgi:hypothetical protein
LYKASGDHSFPFFMLRTSIHRPYGVDGVLLLWVVDDDDGVVCFALAFSRTVLMHVGWNSRGKSYLSLIH